MARSSYIYLAMRDGQPVAAATVKYELKEWLETRESLEGIELYRISGYPWLYSDNPLVRPMGLDEVLELKRGSL